MPKPLPQPFELEEIKKDPKAVVIALLIGLLLTLTSVIGVLYYRKEEREDECNKKIERLYAQMINTKNERIFFYEKMIFYKEKSEILEKQDSIIKTQTYPLIEKILQK